MASTSHSAEPQKHSSPPPLSPPLSPPLLSPPLSLPPPSLPQPLSPQPLSTLRDPFETETNLPRRNSFIERASKRRCIEEDQDKSLIHGFELRHYAENLLESQDLSSLQEVIDIYVETKEDSLLTIFHSFALHYPNAFSFKLAKILELHPPLLQTRIEIVTLFLHTLSLTINFSMSFPILIELKDPLLHSLMVESEESVFSMLCTLIGLLADRLYQLSLCSWEELLHYVCDCICGKEKFNNKKGLTMLIQFPTSFLHNREFWLNQGNIDLVSSNILEFLSSEDDDFKTLANIASNGFMVLLKKLQRTDLCNIFLPILLDIVEEPEEQVGVLVHKIRRLKDLVTFDNGSIFEGKKEEVFWCMIRAAEVEGASEELRLVTGQVIKEIYDANLIKNLSYEELKRIVVVAMNMLMCTFDDSLWYEVDNKSYNFAGTTEAFKQGCLLFNSLCLDGDEGMFVPMVLQMIKTYYPSYNDWRFRHAAILAVGYIAEKNFKGHMRNYYFDEVGILILKALNDQDPRVIWAAMLAINHLSQYREKLMHGKNHKTLLSKLVNIVSNDSCDRVKLHAIIAIRFLVINCGLDNISPFGEPIMSSLHSFLKHEKQLLQNEAIDTLKTFAFLMPGAFRRNYYDTTMEALKVIVFHESLLPAGNVSPESYRYKNSLLVSAKCLEVMVYLVRELGPDDFIEQEVVHVMESLISIEEKCSSEEYLTKCVILKALDRICQCPRVSIDKFIDKIIPMLLESAKSSHMKDDGEEVLAEAMIVQACNTLSYCAVRSSINFSTHLGKVAPRFLSLLGSSSFQIRKASILGLPNLLLSLKVSDKNITTKSGLTFLIVKLCLIAELKKETDKVLLTVILRILARCIQTASSFFGDELIKVVADAIKYTITKVMKIETSEAQEVGTSEGRSESLPAEDILQEVVHLIAATIDTFKDRFMLHVDDLMSNVAMFLADDNPDRLIAFAISIFNVILPLFPNKFLLYLKRYNFASCFALKKSYPCFEQHATRAIGICAMFGGDQYKASVKDGILRLNNVLNKRTSINEEYEDGYVRTLYDTAVAALGKIYEFHRDSIDPMEIQNWLNFLPLNHDFNEAKYAHGLLSKFIQSSDKHLFGSNNKNLPQIISVVKEILSGPNLLVSEEAINQMIDFIDQHGGMKIKIGEVKVDSKNQAL